MNKATHPVWLATTLFVVALAVYTMTMPVTVTLEDAGLFQMVCFNNGLAHPPGYPLFSIVCNAIVFSPEIANGNLVSTLFGALTIVAFFLILRSITQDNIIAASASLAYAFSATFWAQATIIEVYTLAAFLVYLCWYLLTRYIRNRHDAEWLLACLVFGLALANHWPLALLCAPALLAVAWPEVLSVLKKMRSLRFASVTILAFVTGLTPYFYLITRPEDVFGVYGPITNLPEFVDYVLRGQYDDNKAGAAVADKIAYLGWLPLESLRQFGFPLSLLAAIGAYSSFRMAPLHLAIAFMMNFLGSTFFLTLLLGFEFDRNGQSIFMAYPLIAYGSISIWLAYSLLLLKETHPFFGRRLVKTALGALIVAVVVLTNFPSNNRSDDAWVEDYFRLVLESLPEEAVLFVDGDLLSFPVGYLHYSKGLRPDLTVYNWNSLTFPNRLTPVTTPKTEREEILSQFIKDSNRPVFTIEPRFSPTISYGLYEQFQTAGQPDAYLLPEALTILDSVSTAFDEGRIFRQQELELAEFIFASFTKLYIRRQAQSATLLPPEQRVQFNRLLGTFSGKMMLIEHELGRTNPPPDKLLLMKAAVAAESQMPAHIAKRHRAMLYYYFARILLLDTPELGAALEKLDQSIRENPAFDNPAYCARTNLNANSPGRACESSLL